MRGSGLKTSTVIEYADAEGIQKVGISGSEGCFDGLIRHLEIQDVVVVFGLEEFNTDPVSAVERAEFFEAESSERRVVVPDSPGASEDGFCVGK